MHLAMDLFNVKALTIHIGMPNLGLWTNGKAQRGSLSVCACTLIVARGSSSNSRGTSLSLARLKDAGSRRAVNK